MTIKSGTKIGSYEIVGAIGKGGMGEVYKAHDSRLDREVAIKVLPSEMSSDEERLRRFEQEAKATSALNHPNILTVYDIGEHDGSPFIVAELLEGEELRERLDEGSIPLRKVTDYAQQIVSGLSAAHEKGIVHRDLKPENLFITKDDRVKILDFGLAKLRETSTNIHGSEDATRRAMTDPGVVMGTVGYMSPEQVRGVAVDHRSDIFSFGLILYEMITGRRAFQHETMADTMSAILKEEPPELVDSNPNISPALERIVRRCLEKKPERRFHSAHDLGFALESLSAPTSSSGANMTTTVSAIGSETERSPWFNRIPWAAALLLLVGCVVLGLMYLRQSPPAETVSASFTVAAPEKATGIFGPRLSPDGRHLVFEAVVEGKSSLWLRPLGSLTAQQLPGTEGVFGILWSPDSRTLGVFVGGELKKFELGGGAPQTLCRLPAASGGEGTWNRDGVILFPGAAGIYRVPATGGEPALTLRSDPPGLYGSPVFLPDGRHFLVRRRPAQGAAEIHLAALDRQETTRLLAADSGARYANGHLLFGRAGALLAASFDADSLKLTSEPFVVADKSRGSFSVSDNGSLVYDPNALTDNQQQQLTWLDRTGKPLGTVGPTGDYSFPRLSPDGKRVAVVRRDPQTKTRDIYVIDIARGVSSRLTFDPGDDNNPVWSPDGSHIGWSANRDGAWQIYQKLASGVGPEELLLKSDVAFGPGSWSADGRFLLYTQDDPKTNQDLWVLPLAGDRQPTMFLQTPFREHQPRISPDGRWIAYTSYDQGRPEVYVQTFPASSGKWQISTNGGSSSLWRSDGKELYYLSGNKLMAVEVKPGGSFEATAPREIFDDAPARAGGIFAVTAAGDRFLFVTAREEAASLQFTVVTNWMAEVKK